MKHLYLYLYILTLSVSFFSCKKDEASSSTTSASSTTGFISFYFDHKVGDKTMALSALTPTVYPYTNAAGENYNISTFKYYVSNFKLTQEDGTVYTVPQDSSYFLIDASNPSSQTLKINAPIAKYKSVSFVFGVDSSKSVSALETRKGVLEMNYAQGQGMYWSWNTGYRFLRFEGKYDSINTSTNAHTAKSFTYHIGLFGGGWNGSATTLNNVKTITLDLTSKGAPQVSASVTPVVSISMDANKIFTGTKLANYETVMGVAYSATVANTFTTLFTHDKTTQ